MTRGGGWFIPGSAPPPLPQPPTPATGLVCGGVRPRRCPEACPVPRGCGSAGAQSGGRGGGHGCGCGSAGAHSGGRGHARGLGPPLSGKLSSTGEGVGSFQGSVRPELFCSFLYKCKNLPFKPSAFSSTLHGNKIVSKKTYNISQFFPRFFKKQLLFCVKKVPGGNTPIPVG